MVEFNDRIEGEIKTHENEMIKKAIIKKYGDKNLIERIQYVTSIYKKDLWSEQEMFDKLTELGLKGKDSIDDVRNALKNPS